jgi:tetratricopeptide (TPR) repeat protein
VLFLALAAPPARAAEAAADLYLRTLQSSAWVIAPQDRRVTLTGTGWLLDVKDRLLITNQHVVGQDTAVTVMFPLYRDGRLVAARDEYTRYLRAGEHVFRGTVVATDAGRDLALIQLDRLPRVPAFALAEGGADRGDRVHFLGNPGDGNRLWVSTAGTVVRAAADLVIEINTGLQFKARMLTVQTEEPIRPGYSGGPVVNDRGEVVGVSTTRRKVGRRAGCVDVAEVRTFVAGARRLVNPQTAADFKSAGAYHLDQKRYDRAVEAFTRAVRLAPSDPDAYVLRGSARVGKGDYPAAAADYNQALTLDPNHAGAYFNRAELYRLVGRYDLALADFGRSLRHNPQHALAYYNRSLVHRARGDLEKARADYRQALALAPALADYRPDPSPAGRPRPADEVERYLPDDAGFVLGLNVRQLATAPAFAQAYRARLDQLVKEQERWQVLLAGLAVDPARDLTRVVLSGPVADAEASAHLRVLVQGRFDPDRFRTLADNAYKAADVPDGLGGRYRVYELPDARRQAPGYFALASATTVVFSPSRDEVVDALAKGAGWRRTALSQEQVRAGLGDIDAGQGLWLVVPDGAGALNLAEAAPAAVLVAAGDGDRAHDVAERLGQEVARLQEGVRTAAARHAELAPLVNLVTAVRVRARGPDVVLEAQAPGRAN